MITARVSKCSFLHRQGKHEEDKQNREHTKMKLSTSQIMQFLQGSAKRHSPGLVNSVHAIAFNFCLAMPAAFTQPKDHLVAELCTGLDDIMVDPKPPVR